MTFKDIEKDIENIRKNRERLNKRMDDLLNDIYSFQTGKETITINGETHIVQDVEWCPVQTNENIASKTSLSASDILEMELGDSNPNSSTDIRGFIHGLML